MTVERAGIPPVQDVIGQYRLHCDMVADGELPRPQRALLIEHSSDGGFVVQTFGMGEDSKREKIACIGDCLKALGTAIQQLNAAAAN